MIMKNLCWLLLLPASLSWGAQVNYGGGTNAFNLLSRGTGARGLAMGRAFEAVADDASGALWNPAAPGYATGYDLGIHHDSWIAGTSNEGLTGVMSLGGWGGLA